MDGVTHAPARHRLTVHEYHRMGEAAVFGDNTRIELIDGELIDMAPIGNRHAGVVDGLTELLILACAGRASVRTQNPVRLTETSEPQPDLAVLRRRTDFYVGKTPEREDVLALIEVADSSLDFDRTVKLPMYARAGVPEVWIIDLRRRSVEVHRTPSGDTYLDVSSHPATASLELAMAPGVEIHLDRVFAAMI